MRATFLRAAALALGLGLAAAAPVGAINATALPDRKELQSGEVLVVTVLVKDAPTVPTVRPDPVADCTIIPLGPGRRTTPELADGGRLSEAITNLSNRITGALDNLPDSKEKAKAAEAI